MKKIILIGLLMTVVASVAVVGMYTSKSRYIY